MKKSFTFIFGTLEFLTIPYIRLLSLNFLQKWKENLKKGIFSWEYIEYFLFGSGLSGLGNLILKIEVKKYNSEVQAKVHLGFSTFLKKNYNKFFFQADIFITSQFSTALKIIMRTYSSYNLSIHQPK